MSTSKHFTLHQAREIGATFGIDWDRFDAEQFHMDLEIELDHALHVPATGVTGRDPLRSGRIAVAHLTEFATNYTSRASMEQESYE
jgi:hypothetical protein